LSVVLAYSVQRTLEILEMLDAGWIWARVFASQEMRAVRFGYCAFGGQALNDGPNVRSPERLGSLCQLAMDLWTYGEFREGRNAGEGEKRGSFYKRPPLIRHLFAPYNWWLRINILLIGPHSAGTVFRVLKVS
jgi:hypothetical protein